VQVPCKVPQQLTASLPPASSPESLATEKARDNAALFTGSFGCLAASTLVAFEINLPCIRARESGWGEGSAGSIDFFRQVDRFQAGIYEGHSDINGLVTLTIIETGGPAANAVKEIDVAPAFDQRGSVSDFLEFACSDLEGELPMHFTFFSPGFSDSLNHLFITISTFLSGFRTAL
jgi:hypothetical protein